MAALPSANGRVSHSSFPAAWITPDPDLTFGRPDLFTWVPALGLDLMDPAPAPALGLLIPVDPEVRQGKVLRATAAQAAKVVPQPVRAAAPLRAKVALLLEGANPRLQPRRRRPALPSPGFLPVALRRNWEAKESGRSREGAAFFYPIETGCCSRSR